MFRDLLIRGMLHLVQYICSNIDKEVAPIHYTIQSCKASVYRQRHINSRSIFDYHPKERHKDAAYFSIQIELTPSQQRFQMPVKVINRPTDGLVTVETGRGKIKIVSEAKAARLKALSSRGEKMAPPGHHW